MDQWSIEKGGSMTCATCQKPEMRLNIASIAAGYTATYEEFMGEPCVVVPVVLLAEGVHNDYLYRQDDIGHYAQAWNGIPVTINHPRTDSGENISANSPEMIEQQCVGRVFKVHMDNGKLVGAIYASIGRLERINSKVLEQMEQGLPLDVSTGLYADEEGVLGTWNGEEYKAAVVNFKPDHLAILTDTPGACSLADGCGIRGNKELAMKVNSMFDARVHIANSEVSHGQVRDALSSVLSSLDNQAYSHIIIDIYENDFVYVANGANPNEADDGPLYYRRTHNINKDGVAEIGATAERVEQQITYAPVTNEQEEPDMGKKEKIEALIACHRTRFTETDEEWMMQLEEEQLDKLSPAEVEAQPQTPPPPPEPEAKVEEEEEEKVPATPEEYIAKAPQELQAVLTRALSRDRAIKDDVIRKIMANKRNKFSECQLKAKGLDELEAIAELAAPVVNYEGRAGVMKENEGGPITVPDMPAVFEKL